MSLLVTTTSTAPAACAAVVAVIVVLLLTLTPVADVPPNFTVAPAKNPVPVIVIGVLPAVVLYVFGSMRFHGKRSLFTSFVAAVLVAAFTWALFDVALSVELYPGVLFSEV